MTSSSSNSSFPEEERTDTGLMDPSYLKHSSNWLDSVNAFLKETQTNHLHLESRAIGVLEVKPILEFLPDSEVSELSLCNNNLRGGMKNLSKLLAKTKLKKLNLFSCNLSEEDVLCIMEILKYTQISDLDISSNPIQLIGNDARKFTSFLLESHVTNLNFPTSFFNAEFTRMLVEALPSTSLTSLDLTGANFTLIGFNVLETLFLNVHRTSITDLSLSNLNSHSLFSEDQTLITVKIIHNLLKMLFEKIKDSKIEKLVLSHNEINDALMNILAEGLVNSNVKDLDVSKNKIAGANDFGRFLKSTNIKTLNLRGNPIEKICMFNFPDFLNGTSVVELDISHCSLTPEIWEKLMKSLEFSKLSKLVVGHNETPSGSFYAFLKNLCCANIDTLIFSSEFVPLAAGPMILTKYLKASKVRNVDVSFDLAVGLADFFEGSKNSPITCVKILSSCTHQSHLLKSIVNTTFTCLDLSSVLIGHNVTKLAVHLKFTAISRLLLRGNNINDTDAHNLARCLKETKIVELDLSKNSIKNRGAKALACSLKNAQVCHLKLNENQIGTDGLKFLAEKIENTCVTVLDVFSNCENCVILVDSVLWKNRALIRKLVRWFVQVAPETLNNNFCFNRICNNLDVSSFLEDCLVCYKMIIEQPAAINVLEKDESIPFSKAEISSLMSEKFPEQFSSFIGACLEADLVQHIGFLKRAEELQLSKLVELLLLNRPIYTIEENLNILHPYVYQLLHKYKHPICNFAIEPQGKKKIMDYFMEHVDLDGAENVLKILRFGRIF